MKINVIENTTGFISSLIKRMKEHDVSGMAAQLAFFFLLSLFPLLIVIATLVPYLPFTHQDIVTLLATYVPEDSMLFIEGHIRNIMEGSGKLLSVGIIGTLWTASNAMNGLLKAFNKAYNIKEQRKYLIRRAIALVLTIGMIFLFVIALALPVFGKQIGLLLFENIGYDNEFLHIWDTIRWALSTLILFSVITIIYWILPYLHIKHRSVLRGSIFATTGWTVVSYGFSFYVNNFTNYTSTYGSIGGVIVLMLWFYLTAHIILLGCEINAMTNEKETKAN